MTEVTINRKDGQYVGFSLSGHTGYAKRGKPDLLCCAVSVLVENTVNALEELAGEHITVRADERQGLIDCRFGSVLQDSSRLLVDAMVYGLKHLSEQYGTKYLQIHEREV